MAYPAGSTPIGGMAVSADGALYVTLGSGATIASPTISSPTFTGQIKADSGTVGAPSYSFTEDPDSGFIWSVATAQIIAVINGTGGYSWGANAARILSDRSLSWTTSLTGSAGDAHIWRSGGNSLVFSGTALGTATSRTEGNKTVTAIANAAATDILTVTIPNAAHHAVLEIEVQGALGAGGAIGAGSAMATNTYKIAIVRTAGVATVATATAATHAVAVAVAGSETVTATAAVTAMSGAVGATQTFTVQITITRSGGSSTNHVCVVNYKLVNANASGITIA